MGGRRWWGVHRDRWVLRSGMFLLLKKRFVTVRLWATCSRMECVNFWSFLLDFVRGGRSHEMRCRADPRFQCLRRHLAHRHVRHWIDFVVDTPVILVEFVSQWSLNPSCDLGFRAVSLRPSIGIELRVRLESYMSTRPCHRD